MKKIISLILTLAMLLSMSTFVAPVSAETEVNDLFMADASREEFLNTPATEYLEIPYTVDGFATVEEVFKYYPRDNAATDFPTKDVDGNPITNYVKGYYSQNTMGSLLFLIDSILGNAEGKYSGYYLNATDAKTAKSYTFKINGNPKFKLQSTDVDGTMHFLYNHNGVNFKMGPIGGNGAHHTSTGGYNIHKLPNEVPAYTSAGTIENPTSVNILMTTWTANGGAIGGGYAGLFPVNITYADGTTLTKYALSVDNLPSNDTHVSITGGASSTTGDGDRLAKTIVYVPKTTDISTGAKIKAAEKYLSESTSADIIGKAITLDDVKFPNDDLIIKGESALFGDLNIARNASAGFDNGRRYCPVGFVDYINIPVTKKVASVHMKRDISVSLNWKDENGNAVAVKNDQVAYLPVTIEGASDDYYYFAKLGRLCNGEQAVFAVTITGQSLQDEIDAFEAEIATLDATYNSAQKNAIASCMNTLESLKAKGVLESDIDEAAIAKLNGLYETAKEEIKAAQIDAVQSKITAMAFNYETTMRKEVEGIKAEYDALLNSGILSSEFNQDLLAKFSKVYDVYTVSSAIEDKVEAWGSEYLYTMYDEVIATKAVVDEYMPKGKESELEVIAFATVAKVDSMNKLAVTGLRIDERIDALDLEYSKDMLETLIEIKIDIDVFKAIGGTDKGLAYAEIFNSLYETAGPDLLQRDIDNVVDAIEGLPEIYSTSLDGQLEQIQSEINAIELKGGVIPSDAASKYAIIVAQKSETPAYTTFDLPYNKDVFESLSRYQAQYKDKNGAYVKNEAGQFEPQVDNPWTFVAFVYSTSTLDEGTFASKLGLDLTTNKATIGGIPYQFGKIKSEPDGVINESNAFASSVAKSVVIDVPNNVYSKLHAAMWANADQGGVTVTYKYADGSSSTEATVTKVAGGRSAVSTLVSTNGASYKTMNSDNKASINFYRAYNPTYDTGAPGGGYSIALVDHILTPNDQKILDKVEITFATTDANLFAMTGQIANSGLLNKVLKDSVNAFEATDEKNIRSVLEGCTNIMDSLDAKEIAYSAELADAVAENKNTFVAVEKIERYTDLDNMTFTVKFSGPVAQSSITKALFSVTKNGEAFADYTLVPVEENGEIREVKVVIANDYNYSAEYVLKLSEAITGVSGKTILDESVVTYDAKPAVNTEFVFAENGTGSVKLTNNMSGDQEVTAIVAVYNKNNQMVAKFLVNKVLAAGETINQAVSFQLEEGQTVECLVLDSLTNSRKIFNTFVVE